MSRHVFFPLASVFVWVALLTSFGHMPAISSTLVVGQVPPATFLSIQAAIDAAASGDSISVQPGTYLENIDFKGKSLQLVSQAGRDLTTIDGSGTDDAVINLTHGEDSRTLIEGFTITGGRGHGGPPDGDQKSGGGIFINNASATIRNNEVSRNTATDPRNGGTGFGGGIMCQGTGTVQIEDNVVENNSAGLDGGGIGLIWKSTGTIRRNTCIGNSVVRGDGGGLWVFTIVGGILIEGNRFLSNTVGDHGGGVYIASGHTQLAFDFVLRNNIIADNLAEGRSGVEDTGGGCWIAQMVGSVSSNTFSRNMTASNLSLDGSGLAVVGPSNVDIRFNILALNLPGAGFVCRSTAQINLQRNLFWANLPIDVSGSPCAGQYPGDNLVADPQFCDSLSAENFSLAASSPALNYPAGPIGAIPTAGCSGVAVEPTTWSRIKVLYDR